VDNAGLGFVELDEGIEGLLAVEVVEVERIEDVAAGVALVFGADVDDQRVRVIDELAEDLLRGDLVNFRGNHHGGWQHGAGGGLGCEGRRTEPEEQECWHEEVIHE